MLLLSSVSKFCRQVAINTFTSRKSQSTTMVRVTVKEGDLEGKLEKSVSGKSYASFKGIPYAAPPVGKLRFKAPLPPLKWIGVRNATKHGDMCPHVDLLTGLVLDGSDDCLFLNVYTPNVNAKSLPVMVWIHGGAFYSGSGNDPVYGPDYLLEENIVLVTINYRLEALGFLCLDTEEVPGNAGLKDQVAALKWVKENIHKFGGDSNNITVFGESAGGASATYHMISPMSKGLANKVIAQSGCFLAEWTMTDGGRERAFRLGKYLGKDTSDINELLEYLQSLPVEKLCKVTFASISAEEKKRGLPICFGPTIEKFNNVTTFINEPVRELIRKKSIESVPILLGYTNKEGIINLGDSLRKAKDYNENFDRKIHKEIVQAVTPDMLEKIVKKVRQFYFGDKSFSEENANEIIDYDSDYNFSIPVIELAGFLGKTTNIPVFLYRFSVDSDMNFVKMGLTMGKTIKGASHADDVFYIFKTLGEFQEGSESWLAMKRTVRLWTNFAKYGKPTPFKDDLLNASWLPVESNKLNFLEIATDKLIPGVDPDKERFDLWMDVRQMASINALRSKI